MTMTLTEYYRKIYRLSYITRYCNIVRIKNEDVAQHSFFVAALVMKLHDDYDFNLGEALQAAVSHDITEADISDITHQIKANHPDLAMAIHEAELIEITKYPKAVRDGFWIFENDIIEGKIANLADALQVLQYIESELELGNNHVSEIAIKSRERITELREELIPYERRHKKCIIRTE